MFSEGYDVLLRVLLSVGSVQRLSRLGVHRQNIAEYRYRLTRCYMVGQVKIALTFPTQIKYSLYT